MRKLRDSDIREVLLTHLLNKFSDDENIKIINELGVLHGQSRVDIAVINGMLHGFEIKSESDTLLRLPSQIEDYNKVFDRMTIVVQRNHLHAVRKIVPKWWGILLVTRNKDQINLREVRKGRCNLNVDPFSLTHLLWRNEALDILKERGLQKGYLSKPRAELYEKICNSFTLEEIKVIVNEQLRNRENWRVDC
ncbi:sce7726 family protein [Bacillus haynesii]|uniref:sce7726 family protein n=1 Tax=Bacillus haynesii TaxID=1925021 RepID=UPI002280C862|nr:sce7726 family protein [Bacillus haynesii]MCY9288600.1 sce7726 family protein [Bacillus haynesii]